MVDPDDNRQIRLNGHRSAIESGPCKEGRKRDGLLRPRSHLGNLRDARDDERLAIWRQTYLSESNTARIIALDISRNLDVLDLTLRDPEGGLSFPGLDGLPLKERNLVLYDRVGSAEFFAPIIVISERGDLSIESSGITPPPLNYTDRDYFKFLRDHLGGKMYLGRPVRSKIGDGWTLPMARRVARPEGTFAGVVAGGLRLDYIMRLFQQVELGVNDTITLILARDSTVAARWPEQPDTIGFAADAPSLSGDGVQSIRGQSRADGQDRLWVTSQIGAYPLRVTVEVSTSPLFSAWHRRVVAMGLVLVFVCVLVAVLVFWLIRELR